MPFSLRRLTRTQLIAFGLLIIGSVVGFAINKRNTFTNSLLPVATEVVAPSYEVQKATGLPELERVTLRAAGFEPAQITRPKKDPFFLYIENRSRQRELSYQLSDKSGKKVNDKEQKHSTGKLAWSGIIDLPPGTYFLTEATNKEWLLTITIENK